MPDMTYTPCGTQGTSVPEWKQNLSLEKWWLMETLLKDPQMMWMTVKPLKTEDGSVAEVILLVPAEEDDPNALTPRHPVKLLQVKDNLDRELEWLKTRLDIMVRSVPNA